MGRSRGETRTRSPRGLCRTKIPCLVLSFMSAFGAPKSPTSTSFSGPQNPPHQQDSKDTITNSASPQHAAAPAKDSPTPRTRERSSSMRPMSMVQTYQPPIMEIAQDTIAELQPIFSFLNSHSNKLYQEGYFLKLNDLDSSAPIFSSLMHDLANSIVRWATQSRQIMERVLRSTRWHHLVIMGCLGT